MDENTYVTGLYDDEQGRVWALAELGGGLDRFDLSCDEATALWRVLVPMAHDDAIPLKEAVEVSKSGEACNALTDNTFTVSRYAFTGMCGNVYDIFTVTLPSGPEDGWKMVKKSIDEGLG